jgi:hypothetical protein
VSASSFSEIRNERQKRTEDDNKGRVDVKRDAERGSLAKVISAARENAKEK